MFRSIICWTLGSANLGRWCLMFGSRSFLFGLSVEEFKNLRIEAFKYLIISLGFFLLISLSITKNFVYWSYDFSLRNACMLMWFGVRIFYIISVYLVVYWKRSLLITAFPTYCFLHNVHSIKYMTYALEHLTL